MTEENKINDGGPAFPTEARSFSPTSKSCYWHNGMSLRDWFAGMTLCCNRLSNHGSAALAEEAYELADAMLKEREKRSNPRPNGHRESRNGIV